ncbi:MAG: hypothetical protein ABI920_09335 [Casimicrobiaceae bacterium]
MSREKMRCYLALARNGWLAVCVDAGLYASGATPEAARAALDGKLENYCHAGDGPGARQEPSNAHGLVAHLAYWRARFSKGPSGQPLAYVFRRPPVLIFGLA